MAKELDANVWAVHRPQAKPDGRSPTFRLRQALLTFRFAELLTRTPTRILVLGVRVLGRSKPWQFQRLHHAHNPWHRQSWRNSRSVQALTVPATAPCPQPPASPILELQIPIGSKPQQIRRLRHAHDPWRSKPCHPSSGDCTMPTTPGVPNLRAVDSRRVRAPADPASAPHPTPLRFPAS